MREQTYIIRSKLLYGINLNNLSATIQQIQDEFNISKQAINKHLLELEKHNYIVATGKTKNKSYSLGNNREFFKNFDVDNTLDEFGVYSDYFYWLVEHLPKNIQDIVDWGFTEILNNVKDHSNAESCWIRLTTNKDIVELVIGDNGLGILDNLRQQKNFTTNEQVLLELSKGKLTTDLENHTGLGIFFSSKAFDDFKIISNGEIFNLKNKTKDKILTLNGYTENNVVNLPTVIVMSINLSSKTELKDVFDDFSPAPEYEFDKTIVPLFLANKYNKLISRSQAKQVVNRLEEFKFITFDFDDIENIGQGFADEIFRVFWKKYPELKLDWINASIEVEKMIKRAMNY